MIEGIFVEGLLYGIMALGVFITFRVMDFPDMTVDGSFPFGAALMASLLTAHVHPVFALLIAFAGGALAGAVTAAIHNYLKIPNLLAGIITMTMLWSINIRVMGNRANITLTNQDTLLGSVVGLLRQAGVPPEYAMLVFFILLSLFFKVLLNLFFRTDLGLTLGAMGNNPQMVISTGVDPSLLKFIGLGLSNGLVAIAGAFACQYQGFADVSLGQQIIISGLASVMIGEFLLKSNRIWVLTLRVLLGSILFRALMYLARQYGYDIGLLPTDQRMLTGALIIAALAVSQVRKQTAKAKAVTGLAGAGAAPTAPANGAAKPGAKEE